MEPSPFDDLDGTFHVLVNEQGQHSLWPTFADVPQGWQIALHAAPQADCAAYVTSHWTDTNPHSARS